MPQQEQKKEPWVEMSDVWKTKASYFSWLRGILRRGWNRHPAKIKLLNSRRFKIKNPNPKGRQAEVWGLCCDKCKTIGPMKNYEVDHIHPAGSLRDWDDVEAFTMALLACNQNDLRIVCKPCHQIISYAERSGLSFEAAVIEKRLIALRKLSSSELRDTLIGMGVDISDDVTKKTSLIQIARIFLTSSISNDDITESENNND